jgi:hypothetical protein
MNINVDVTIRRRRTRRIVKTFQLSGIPAFERVLLWVWRELFVSMLANDAGAAQKIPEMFDEINELLDWKAVQNVLYGTRARASASFPHSHIRLTPYTQPGA